MSASTSEAANGVPVEKAAPLKAEQTPVTGLVPPQIREANIRTAWPSVLDASRPAANLGKALIRSIVLAPLGWLLLAPVYFKKVLPIFAKRYRLTNRRLMVQRGWKFEPKEEVALAEIDDVRLAEGSYDPFYRAGDLEVLSGGKVVLRLGGVPGPEAFRHAILNSARAWAPKTNNAPPAP